jgi:hypothetical protein
MILIPVQAQDAFPPDVVIRDGALVQSGNLPAGDRCETGEYTLATGSGSPDGRYVLVHTVPRLVSEEIERFGASNGVPPNNYWLCDQRTGIAQPLAMQPEDASLSETGNLSSMFVHSLPAFSPDSTHIYWTQYGYGRHDYLVGYEISSGETTETVLAIPENYSIRVPISLVATSDALWLWSSFTPLDSSEGETMLIRTDLSGTVLQRYPQDRRRRLDGVLPVLDHGSEKLLLISTYNSQQTIFLFNPATGSITEIQLDALRLTGGDGSLAFVPAFTAEGNVIWTLHHDGVALVGRDGQALTVQTNSLLDMNRLPGAGEDGRVLTMLDAALDRSTNQISEPLATLLENPANRLFLLWGAREWQLAPDRAVTCPDFMESRLIVGQEGRVMDTTPNRIRSEPSLNGTYLGQIEGGDTFVVLDGPVCAEGYSWWYVEYGTLTGWTVEGQGEEYWLEPAP